MIPSLNAATNSFCKRAEAKKHEENYLSTELNVLLLEVIETISNRTLDPDPCLLANLGQRKWAKNMIQDMIQYQGRLASSLKLNLTTENWITRLAQ
jgi:hypothetical protein